MIDLKTIFSVSQFTRLLNEHHRNQFNAIRIQGEVASFTKASSGHWYLVLKDDSAQLKAVMFRQRNVLTGFLPVLGEKVEVLAQLSVYEQRGELQLIVDVLKKAGQGDLHERYLQLKAKLAAEGLFDSSRKKALPTVVFNVGVVTSTQAAALADVKQTLARRAFHVQITVYHTAVQGELAVRQITDALQKADVAGHDALILCRGGGSLEDLWCFNVEAVVRAVAACKTPIVAGIGHESDVTLVEFAADLRAATPTAAAELISRSTQELLAELQVLHLNLQRALRYHLQLLAQQIDLAEMRLITPASYLNSVESRLSQVLHRLPSAVTRNVTQQTNQLVSLQQGITRNFEYTQTFAKRALNELFQTICTTQTKCLMTHESALQRLGSVVEAVSPQRTLERGYAFLQLKEGDEIINSVEQIQLGHVVRATLSDGQMHLNVLQKISNRILPEKGANNSG